MQAKIDFYVAGFLFTCDHKYVALIKKERPDWQKGKLNGVVGKLENGESFEEAQTREFNEECVIYVPQIAWKTTCDLMGVDNDGSLWFVRFFHAVHPDVDYIGLTDLNIGKTDEQINFFEVSKLPELPTMSNLKYLIPMALEIIKGNDAASSFTICEAYAETNKNRILDFYLGRDQRPGDLPKA